GDWILVSHAPWHDLRVNGYALYAMNVATRELRLIHDDPQMSDVDPVPIAPHRMPAARTSTLASHPSLPHTPGLSPSAGARENPTQSSTNTVAFGRKSGTGLILC